MRRLPVWGWALLTIVAAFIRFDFRVGDASLATGLALLAGALLTPRRAAATQLLALPAILLAMAPGPAGEPADWGFAVGRVALALLAARLAGPGRTPSPWLERGLLLAVLATAAWAAAAWEGTDFGLDLRTYYLSVTALGLAIGFYYTLRLVERPRRVLSLAAALAPYYALGLAGAGLARGLGVAEPLGAVDLVFHGLLIHLPGDVLMAVAVAFLTGPKAGRAGPNSR